MIDWLIRRIFTHCDHAWVYYPNSQPRKFCGYCGIGRWSWK